MGTTEFGQLADAARRERGYSLARVAVGIGVLPDGGVLNETQVKRILEGRRSLDRHLIERLIDVLGLDRADAWEAALESADLKPPGLTADMLRKLDLVAAGAMKHSRGTLPVAPELEDADLLRRLGVPQLHVWRRRRDDRRRTAEPVAA
jgi:transcriptional regulator with XRE-family HTH domain